MQEPVKPYNHDVELIQKNGMDEGIRIIEENRKQAQEIQEMEAKFS